MFLTKNDFMAARTCPTKLYYKKLGYPSLSDDDPYLEFLTDGGYMVERMANLLFQDGTEFGHIVESERAFDETRTALEAGNALSLRPPLFTTICLRGLTFFGERATSCAR